MKKQKYPMNPLARTMSERTRLERYHQDKEKMVLNNLTATAKELEEKQKRIQAWWGV